MVTVGGGSVRTARFGSAASGVGVGASWLRGRRLFVGFGSARFRLGVGGSCCAGGASAASVPCFRRRCRRLMLRRRCLCLLHRLGLVERLQDERNHIRAIEVVPKFAGREEVRSLVRPIVDLPANQILTARACGIVSARSERDPALAVGMDEQCEQFDAVGSAIPAHRAVAKRRYDQPAVWGLRHSQSRGRGPTKLRVRWRRTKR